MASVDIIPHCRALKRLRRSKKTTAIISQTVNRLIDVGVNLKILANGSSPNSIAKTSSERSMNNETQNSASAAADKYGVVTTLTAIKKSENAQSQISFLLFRTACDDLFL